MEKEAEAVENLRAFIDGSGLTTGAVSRLTGFSARQIRRWLKGEARPSAIYAELINKKVKRLQAKRTRP